MSVPLCLREISLEDENLVENDLCSRLSGKPGLTLGQPPLLVPSTYMRHQQFASHTLSAKEFLKFLDRVQFCLLSEADCESHEIPKVAQRFPTKDRKDAIMKAWNDPSRTPDNKVETLEISVFNTRMSPSQGLILSEDALLVLEDGAGRVSAALEELALIRADGGNLDDHVMVVRDLVVQLNIDLSGDPIKGMKSFLAYNRDGKKITKGTTLVVENGLLSLLDESEIDNLSWTDSLYRTWVVGQLYENYPIHGSIVEFLPWVFEGKRTISTSFEGRGNASSILTALKDLEKSPCHIAKKSGLSVQELPDAIDFAFRCWFKLCPTSRADARGPNNFHFTSTLAIKVMLLLGIRLYKSCGSDEAKFKQLLGRVFAAHFKHHKNTQYMNKTAKKMDPDRFWSQSKQFADPSTFNSGAANTQVILTQLVACLEDAI